MATNVEQTADVCCQESSLSPKGSRSHPSTSGADSPSPQGDGAPVRRKIQRRVRRGCAEDAEAFSRASARRSRCRQKGMIARVARCDPLRPPRILCVLCAKTFSRLLTVSPSPVKILCAATSTVYGRYFPCPALFFDVPSRAELRKRPVVQRRDACDTQPRFFRTLILTLIPGAPSGGDRNGNVLICPPFVATRLRRYRRGQEPAITSRAQV